MGNLHILRAVAVQEALPIVSEGADVAVLVAEVFAVADEGCGSAAGAHTAGLVGAVAGDAVGAGEVEVFLDLGGAGCVG